jgi:hypothetical protein
MALGAQRASVVWLVIREAMGHAAFGAMALIAAATLVFAAPAAAQRFFSAWQVAPSAAQQATLVEGLSFIRASTGHQQPLLVAGVADWGIHLGMIQQFLMDQASGQAQPVIELPYANLPATWGISPAPSPQYSQLLEKALHDNPGAAVVILYHQPGSPFRGRLYPWVLAWQENYIRATAESRDLQLVGSLDTHEGLTVTIYRSNQLSRPGGAE